MDEQEMMKALAKPFAVDEVEWRAQRVGITGGKPWAMVLCYLTNRAIMNRLDEVFGLANWRNEFIKWGEKSTLCGISCKINGEWVTKYDGAEETDVEAVKGGFSDAMKRAAVQWGMGRYLYNLTEGFAECSLDKKPGWRKAKADNTTFYWCPPALPDWALPPPSAKAGKTRPGAGTPPPASNHPQGDTPAPEQPPQSETEILLSFMAKLGVTRDDLENAIGAEVEDFTAEEKQQIKSAIAKMRRDKCDFVTAFTSK